MAIYNVFFFALFLSSFVNSQNLTFTNPIFDGDAPNPCIKKLGDYYYLILSSSNSKELVIYKSPILTNFRNVERKVVFTAPEGYGLGANEMHEINGELYLYFHMSGLFVIKADNPLDPMGNWGCAIRVLNNWDYPSLDGSVMKHNNQLYFVWASIRGPIMLYIAPLTSPTRVGSPKVQLRRPRHWWECRGGCVSEGATFLYNGNVTYMIHSTTAGSSPDYCLTQMSIRDGADPMVVANWDKVDGPVFWRNDDEDVYNTGRAEFTTSPDGTETWMVYSGTISTKVEGRRLARLEKIEWNADGSPRFPRPTGIHQLQHVPSGQTTTSTCSCAQVQK